MSDLLQKCEVCGALIDEEDLFCANCGAEAPLAEQATREPGSREATHNFQCLGCGASMSYDASAETLRCPFCGSDGLDRQKDAKVLAPSRVVPFRLSREEAEQQLRAHLGRGFWRPGDLAESARVTKMTPVYVPYWVFRAQTHTFWTADTSHTPVGARGDWYPLSGEHRGSYAGLLVGASGALTPAETAALCPFDLAGAVPPEQVDLDNATVEQFGVQRKYARPLARQGLQNLEAGAIQQKYVPGRCRNLQVNTRIENLASEPTLLPVWMMAYRYKERLFRFLVNGQTGRATGQKPTSTRKIVMAVVIGIVAVALLVLLMMICGGVVAAG
jgi:DNA-directed RNA polymerase subunit RPC12/RpoP